MTQTKSTIRFGVICAGESLPRWQAESLQRVLEMEGFVLAGALVVGLPERDMPQDRRKTRSGAWQRFEGRVQAGLAAQQPCALAELGQALPRSRQSAAVNEHGRLLLAPESCRFLMDLDLDFLLSLLPWRLESDGPPLARRGEWFWEVGEPALYPNPVPAFWEIYEGRDTTFAGLYEQPGSGAAKALLRGGRFKTRDSSYAANLRQVLEGAARWLPQACLDLRNGVLEDQRRLLPLAPERGRRAPGVVQFLRFAVRIRYNKLRNLYRHFFRHRHWGLALSALPIKDFLGESSEAKVIFLPRPDKAAFHADPFGWWRGEELVILFEHCASVQGMGSVGCAVVPRAALSEGKAEVASADCSFSRSELKFPHHASYPFLFAHEGRQYCIPETAEAAKVSLYENRGKLAEWTHVGDLLSDFAAVDSSVVYYQGRWWLFCTNMHDNPDSHLYIWHAEDLQGPWLPHANNPVKMDIGCARPAGTPFVHEGVLYRPAQNCSRNYGGGVRIQRVELLTPQSFREENCADLDWLPRALGVDGMHTLSRVGDVTLLDYYRHTFLPGGFLYRLRLFREARKSRFALKQA